MAGEKRRREPERASQNAESGLATLHRARVADWRPAPVAHLATSSDGSLAVAVRDDGNIDFYDLTGPHCSRRVLVSEPGSLTCAAIVDAPDGKTAPRVFVGAFDGTLTELGCDAGAAPLTREDTHGGAVWALAVRPDVDSDADEEEEPRTLAVASEDGSVRLFRVAADAPGAAYERALPGAGGRVTALAWHPRGHALAAAGVDGAVHVRDARSGRELLRVSLSTDGAKAGLVVWALLFLPDGTLVAGDSSGGVSFWDGAHGTLLARFAQHRADVLALAAAPDGRAVWAAGVDPALAMFRRERGGAWALVAHRRPHTRDVRALAVADGPALDEGGDGPLLLSAGNDAVVLARPCAAWVTSRGDPIEDAPQRPMLAAAPAPGAEAPAGESLVASASSAGVRLWRLRPAAAQGRPGAPPAPAPPPELLAEVKATGVRAVALATAAADPNAPADAANAPLALLAFADARRTTLLRVRLPRSQAAWARKEGLAAEAVGLPEGALAADALLFGPVLGGAVPLVAAAEDGTVQVLEVPVHGAAPPTLRASRAAHALRFKLWALRERARSAARFWEPALQSVALSPDGRALAFAFRRRLQLMELAGPRWGSLLTPGPEALPGGAASRIAGLAFTADGSQLVSLTAKLALARHALPSGQLVPEAEARIQPEALAEALKRLGGALLGVVAHPGLPSVALLATTHGLCVADPTKTARAAKKPAHHSEPGENLRLIRCWPAMLLAVSFAGANQLITVEETWEVARKGTPAPMYRQRYGAA